jgi:hypothetical protein
MRVWARVAGFVIAGSFMLAQALLAQDPVNSDQSKPSQPVATQPSKDPYAVSLGTGELISLNGESQPPGVVNGDEPPGSVNEYADGLPVRPRGKALVGQLFYGLSASAVYSDDPAALGTGKTASTAFTPYVALLEPTRTGSYLLQYSAVVAPQDVVSGGPQVFHTAGVAVVGALSRRLTWSLSSNGSFGSESARLQGPLAYTVVQSTPMASSAESAVLLPATNVLFIENTATLDWRKSARETLGFSLVNTYAGIERNPAVPDSVASHSDAVGAKMHYDRSLSSHYSLSLYGEAEMLLQIPVCQTYGVGAGLAIRVNQAVSLSFAGGPQFSSQACGGAQSANFSASIAVNLTRHDRVYASANRQFSTGYLTAGTWEDNVAAGFAKDMGRLHFTTDAGWVRAEETSPIPTYHGYFVVPRVSFRLTESLSASAAYRDFHGSGGLLGDATANIASVSLEWRPTSKHLRF